MDLWVGEGLRKWPCGIDRCSRWQDGDENDVDDGDDGDNNDNDDDDGIDHFWRWQDDEKLDATMIDTNGINNYKIFVI